MKGWHLTHDSWRLNRKQDGWKMSEKEWLAYLESVTDEELKTAARDLGSAKPPQRVKAPPRMYDDLKAMKNFFSGEEPTEVPVWSTRIVQVIFGFNDASGEGFGDVFLNEEGLSIHVKVWNYKTSHESSNFIEFRNPLEALKKEAELGHFNDAFVFFATDNQTVEADLYNGTSSSESLLEMIIELRALSMKYNFQIFVTHVAGTRMIAQGGNGLSPSDLNTGTMA
mmetsp:Transcript_3333/g.5080  ORF Transcript_3333/g.5080 Transcript_3333/m.5080 type:complete len:225 (-) Transcript_3333:575-1249(-)